MCKKDDRLPHQKSRFSITSKGLEAKTSKGSLQNIYMMLDFLYHKRNLLLRLL